MILDNNKIKRLKALEQVVIEKSLNLSHNNIEILEFLSQNIGGDLIVSNNGIKSLKNVQESIMGLFDCSKNLYLSC